MNIPCERSVITAFIQISTKHNHHQIFGLHNCNTKIRRKFGSGSRAFCSIHNPNALRPVGYTATLPSKRASKGFANTTYLLNNTLSSTSIQSSSDISFGSYNVGLPPTNSQLLKADRYFTNSKANPHLMMMTPKFRNLPVSDAPEVVFLGRSNVGKSSLLNALLEKNIKELAKTSKHPGHTKTLNAYGVNGVTEYSYTPEDEKTGGTPGPKYKKWTGRGGLVVIDTPGYGKSSRVEWGSEIMKYLTSRKQLRRAFLLVESEHGLKVNDMQMLRILHDNGVPHQLVFVKGDKIFKAKDPEKTIDKLREKCARIRKAAMENQDPEGRGKRARLYSDIVFTSTQLHWPPMSNPANLKKMGIGNLRYEVLNACGHFNVGMDASELVESPATTVADVRGGESRDDFVENQVDEVEEYEEEDSGKIQEDDGRVAQERRSRARGRIKRGIRSGTFLRRSMRS